MPEWMSGLSGLIGPAVYLMVAIVSSGVTAAVFISRLVRRVEAIEQKQKESEGDDTLELFRSDLIKHQEQDCERLDEIDSKAVAIKDIVVRTDESMEWVKKAIDELKEAVGNKRRPTR